MELHALTQVTRSCALLGMGIAVRCSTDASLIELFCFLTGRVCQCSGIFGGGAGGDQSTHPYLLLWYRDWADVDLVLTCSVPGV